MKKMTIRNLLPLLAVALIGLAFLPQQKPTLYFVGDSTMKNSGNGWGDAAPQVFDTTRIRLANRAVGGRCTRQILSEGHWERALATMTKGDYLVMAFGHNEGLDTTRGVGVLPGTGDEQIFMTRAGKKVEIRTYGWYLHKFATEAKEKGVTVIIASMIPRSDFKIGADGVDRVIRNDNYVGWSKQVAEKTGSFFIDINTISADKFDKFGRDEVKKLYPRDHTHPNTDGALIHAQSAAEAIKMQPKIGLNAYLKPFESYKLPAK